MKISSPGRREYRDAPENEMRAPLKIETKRLVIRSWSLSDLSHYSAIATDVGYNCFAPPGYFLAKDDAEIVEKLRPRIALYETRGLGKFPIFEKSTGEIVGTTGIDPYVIDGKNEVELGYRLRLAHWDKGYATEAARAIVDYGLKTLKLACIFAFAVKQNRASVQVLRKLGLEEIGVMEHAGLPHLLFRTK